jgi:hypothetical protein
MRILHLIRFLNLEQIWTFYCFLYLISVMASPAHRDLDVIKEAVLNEFYSVSGTVRDSETNEPLSGVLASSVTSLGVQEVMTDENGHYTITMGYEDVITFSKIGYVDFTSEPILGQTSDLDVLLFPVLDLCEFVTCPPGFGCYQGGCFEEFFSVSGTVRDSETNEPLSGVLASSGTSLGLEEVLTDANGNYTITVGYEAIITFSKIGYEDFTSDTISGQTSDLDVLLQPSIDLCEGVTCALGEVCYLGNCYEFDEVFTVSGTVISEGVGSGIHNVKVSSISDGSGCYFCAYRCKWLLFHSCYSWKSSQI